MPTISADVIAAAQAAQRKWGVPASVTLAQYGLESAWGTRMPKGSNNPFGIKAKPGQPAVVATTVDIIHKQPFRKYASIAEAFDDHGRLLGSVSIYRPALDAWRQGDLERGVRLMASKYATDPSYATKILSIIASGHFTIYDDVTAPAVPPAPPRPSVPPAVPKTNWLSVLIALIAELFRRK